MNMRYIWYKLMAKIKGKAIKNSILSKDSKIEAGTLFINSQIGRFSYCGYNGFIVNTDIGAFCSISDNVSIGGGNHPLDWVSTSPAFYKGRDSISKRLASLKFETKDKKTIIGNDVWIGRGVYIKSGITIGDGAIIGLGSIVTKDVEPYSIVVGNPAQLLRYRFEIEIIKKLQKIQWWNMEEKDLKQFSEFMNKPYKFIEEFEKKEKMK